MATCTRSTICKLLSSAKQSDPISLYSSWSEFFYLSLVKIGIVLSSYFFLIEATFLLAFFFKKKS